jgi:hypothetical protein
VGRVARKLAAEEEKKKKKEAVVVDRWDAALHLSKATGRQDGPPSDQRACDDRAGGTVTKPSRSALPSDRPTDRRESPSRFRQ